MREEVSEMNCTMNCLTCDIPAAKCRGGTYKTATDWKGATKVAEKPKISGKAIPAVHICGRKCR